MTVVYRHGDLGHPGTTEEDDDDQLGGFTLFGREEVTDVEAFADGLDLFAARMAAFDMSMQSPMEHHITQEVTLLSTSTVAALTRIVQLVGSNLNEVV